MPRAKNWRSWKSPCICLSLLLRLHQSQNLPTQQIFRILPSASSRSSREYLEGLRLGQFFSHQSTFPQLVSTSESTLLDKSITWWIDHVPTVSESENEARWQTDNIRRIEHSMMQFFQPEDYRIVTDVDTANTFSTSWSPGTSSTRQWQHDRSNI